MAHDRIGPWEAQHRRWAGEFSVEVPQSSHNDASTPKTPPLEGLARYAALGARPGQDGRLHTFVFYTYNCCGGATDCSRPAQQQGLDGQTFTKEDRELDQQSARGARLEDLNIFFPSVPQSIYVHNPLGQNLTRRHLSNRDFGTYFDAVSSQFAGQHHLRLNPPNGFDINGQALPPWHQILPSNVASPSNTQEFDVSPQMGDGTLIRRAANNLAARPVSERATSSGNPYPRLLWATPRSPANYPTPNESYSISRERD